MIHSNGNSNNIIENGDKIIIEDFIQEDSPMELQMFPWATTQRFFEGQSIENIIIIIAASTYYCCSLPGTVLYSMYFPSPSQ